MSKKLRISVAMWKLGSKPHRCVQYTSPYNSYKTFLDKNARKRKSFLAECKLKIYTGTSGVMMSVERKNILTVVTMELPGEPSILRKSHRVYTEDDTAGALVDYFQRCTALANEAGYRVDQHSANGGVARFIPFVNESQWIETVGALEDVDLVLVDRINESCLRNFREIQEKVWDRYGKLIMEIGHREKVMNAPDAVLFAFEMMRPRNPQSYSAQPRNISNPDERYEQLVELINMDLSVNEIAAKMHLSAPTIYLMRSKYRDELERDTIKTMRAMRFHSGDK